MAAPKVQSCQEILRELSSLTATLTARYEAEVGQLRTEVKQLRMENGNGEKTQKVQKPKAKAKKGADSPPDASLAVEPAQKPKEADTPKGPQRFEAKSCWAAFLDDFRKERSDSNHGHANGILNSLGLGHHMMAPSPSQSGVLGKRGPMARILLQPTCTKRLAWDVVGTLLVVYDMLFIPLSVFRTPDSAFLAALDWFVQIFWTLDVGMSCITGYFHKGNMIMEPAKILAHYSRTWLPADLCVVGTDWVCTVMDLASSQSPTESLQTENVVALIRVLRIFRIVRLLRLAKLKQMINNLYDRINSESISIVVNIIKLVVFLLVLNHFIACVWFLITQWTDGPSWVSVHKFDTVNWEYQYLTSLHWSLTQFTPSSMHVQPQNIGERAFALVIILIALMMFSQVVGSITSSLTQLRQLSEHQWKQFWLLRRYLRQQRVPLELSQRIQRYLEYSCEHEKKQVNLKSILIMSSLSEQLRQELDCAVNLPYVKQHPLFEYLEERAHVLMARVVASGMSRKMYAGGDSLFFEHDVATAMIFVAAGELQYARKTRFMNDMKTEDLHGKGCIGEAIIWTEWTHRGELQAQAESEVIKLDPQTFATVTRTSPALCSQMGYYAEEFLQYLNRTDPANLSDIITFEDSQANIEKLVRHFNVHRDKKSFRDRAKSAVRSMSVVGPKLLGNASATE